MTDEQPKPSLAEQIEAVQNRVTNWVKFPLEADGHRRRLELWRAVLSTLQQHERLVEDKGHFERGFLAVEKECREAKYQRRRAEAERAVAAQQHERAMAALKPFAKIADDYDAADAHRKPHSDGHRTSIALGDCRKARAALDAAPAMTVPPECPTDDMIGSGVQVYRRVMHSDPEAIVFDVWQAMYDEWQASLDASDPPAQETTE